jgi:uncharacterized protein YutE (UPF0331/DUF86 family)
MTAIPSAVHSAAGRRITLSFCTEFINSLIHTKEERIMYFVDRRKIAIILDYVNHLLSVYRNGQWESPAGELTLERIAQNLIESVIDVGNQMIDGFIMRDPGGYEDIVDILEDEQVLPAAEATQIRQVVGLRKMLVKDYTSVDHHRLKAVLDAGNDALNHFSERIRMYIEKELGPVSAFTPDKPSANQ